MLYLLAFFLSEPLPWLSLCSCCRRLCERCFDLPMLMVHGAVLSHYTVFTTTSCILCNCLYLNKRQTLLRQQAALYYVVINTAYHVVVQHFVECHIVVAVLYQWMQPRHVDSDRFSQLTDLCIELVPLYYFKWGWVVMLDHYFYQRLEDFSPGFFGNSRLLNNL